MKVSDSLYKLVSAAMTFFIFTEVIIEPSLAVYEYGFYKNHAVAKDDLVNFRVADHIHPQKFADIALGKALSVDFKELEIAKTYLVNFPETEETDFSKQLSLWELSYLFALKIAQLKKSNSLTPEQQMDVFYKWMVEETLFNAVASVFASLYLSHNPPEKKMIKGIESLDTSKLYHGIQNAAWDLVYIAHWGKCIRQSPNNISWLLCSNDKAMRLIAKSLFVPEEQDEETSLINMLSICWNPNSARNIAKTIINYSEGVQNNTSERNEILKKRFGQFPDMIKNLEIELKLPVSKI